MFLFYIYFNCLTIIIFNLKKQMDIVTRTTNKMVPKHFFSPFTWYLRGGGIKKKWTTEPPGNIQNYNVQAFLSSRRSTDCGPHILHPQLHPSPGLFSNLHIKLSSTMKFQIFNFYINSQQLSKLVHKKATLLGRSSN